MAMLGLRDISSLTTPPLDRRAIVTEVIPYNPVRVKQAIVRELAREGQVFFVHNRVHDIKSAADDVQRLAPGRAHRDRPRTDAPARARRRHAQVRPAPGGHPRLHHDHRERHRHPTANTMIIDDADRFGLADLHQLRGPRRPQQASGLLLPPARSRTSGEGRRPEAAQGHRAVLDAGRRIQDRHARPRDPRRGQLLGAEQSGHIAAVGYEMYCRLLEDAVHTLKHERPPEPPSNTSIEIGIAGIIPRTYIASDQRRLEAYRRLATAASAEELDKVRTDLTEAYGSPPKPVERLLDLAGVRVAASKLGIKTITIREKDVIFRCERGDVVAAKLKTPAGPAPAPAAATSVDMPYSQRRKLAQAAAAAPKETALHVVALPPKTPGDLAEVYFRPPEAYLEPETLLNVLRKRLVG
jgi:transcription-repair coupling factor (superfamily II helicase)